MIYSDVLDVTLQLTCILAGWFAIVLIVRGLEPALNQQSLSSVLIRLRTHSTYSTISSQFSIQDFFRNSSATRVHSAHSATSQRAFWIESAMNLHFVYHTRFFQMKLYTAYNPIMITRSPKSVANLWTARKRIWSATCIAEVPDSAARAQHIIGLKVQPDLWKVWRHWQWRMRNAVGFQNPTIPIVIDVSVDG